MTRTITGVAVGIPAHDEAERIEACVRSVLAAAERVDVPVSVVVAADHCTDATADLAEAALVVAGPTVRSAVVRAAHRSAGATRATALDAALDLLGMAPAGAWLATTDGDTVVDPTWLAVHVRWARSGVDGIAGLVAVDWEGGPSDLPARYAASIAAGGTQRGHAHVHGANLGVLGARWVEVGGCGLGQVAEDHELWARLRAIGAEVVGVDDLLVTTSGRLAARAPDGFAAYLSRLVDTA